MCYISSENIDRKDYLALGLNMEQVSIKLPSHGVLPFKDQCILMFQPPTSDRQWNPSLSSGMCTIQSCLAVADYMIYVATSVGEL